MEFGVNHVFLSVTVFSVGVVDNNILQEEERCLRAQHVAYQEQQAKLQMERQLQLRQQEEAAKKNVTKTLKQKRENLKQKEVFAFSLY